MDGQPDRSLRNTRHGVRRASRQKEMITRCEYDRLAGNLEHGLSLDEHDPFILGLSILTRRDGRGTHDPLDDEVPVAQDCLEAFALVRRICINEEIPGSHVTIELPYDRASAVSGRDGAGASRMMGRRSPAPLLGALLPIQPLARLLPPVHATGDNDFVARGPVHEAKGEAAEENLTH